MNSQDAVNLYIIGQDVWKRTITILMESMIQGDFINALIIGPSGYGKTYIATIMLNFFKTHSELPVTKITCDGKNLLNLENYSGILIDEAHKLPNPEHIYGILDQNYKNLIFCTNQWGDLPEPLVNRCIVIQLVPYSLEELSYISKRVYLDSDIIPGDNVYMEIAKRSRGVPRLAKNISRYTILGHGKDFNLMEDDIKIILEHYGIYEGGFRPYDYTYIKSLKMTGGRASLRTLASLSNLNPEFILEEVEPFLIREKVIQITPRGRILL